MPVDFTAIIRDEKIYPDSTPIQYGTDPSQTTTLGAIRDLSKKDRQQVTEALGMIQQERERVAARQKEVDQFATQAKAIHDELSQQQQQARQQADAAERVKQSGGYDPEQVYENDIWYGPIRKRGTAWDQAIKKNAEDLQQVVGAVKALVGLWTDDRMDNQYEATAEERKRSKSIADWSREQFQKYVDDNKVYDKRGIPSIREAVTRLTAQERAQAEHEDAYQRGLREGEMRARMGSMPRPASASAAMGEASTPAPKSMDEALSPESIQADDELMRMLASMNSIGADLITGGKP